MSFLEFSRTGISSVKLDENKIDNSISVNGTNGSNGSRSVIINGVEHGKPSLNGLSVVIFDSSMNVLSDGVFDIYDNATARNALISRLQNLGSDHIALFATGGTKGIRSTLSIDTEFERLGSWKWLGTDFLNRKPKTCYSAICHGTYGFVYESVSGTTATSPKATISTTFKNINELGDNGFGKPLYQDDTEYDSNTTLVDKAIDNDTFITASAFMKNDINTTVSLEVEFFDDTTSLDVMTFTCDSIDLWQSYNIIYDTPTGTNRIVVRTVHTGTGTAKIDSIQIGLHNGFSPVPEDTIISSNGIYSSRVSQSVHGHNIFDTDWYDDSILEANVHSGVELEQDVIGDVYWNDQVLITNEDRAITQTNTSITLNSVNECPVDNLKPYFIAIWVKAVKDAGSVSLGVKAFDNGVNTNLLDDSGAVVTDPEAVNIPSSDFSDTYKLMYFWILPYTWTNTEVTEFKNSVSGYHESQFNIDNPNNSSVYQMTSDVDGLKLFVTDKDNTTTSDVKYALPVIKEVSLLSFTTGKLEALNYKEM